MSADFLWPIWPVGFQTPKKARISQQEKDKAQITASKIATRTRRGADSSEL